MILFFLKPLLDYLLVVKKVRARFLRDPNFALAFSAMLATIGLENSLNVLGKYSKLQVLLLFIKFLTRCYL